MAAKAKEIAELKAAQTPKVEAPKAPTASVKRDAAPKAQNVVKAENTRGVAIAPPKKPSVSSRYRLAGMSASNVWIEANGQVSKYSIGQAVPDFGTISEFKMVGDQYVVVTTSGLIVP
jgi:hypothetical protein